MSPKALLRAIDLAEAETLWKRASTFAGPLLEYGGFRVEPHLEWEEAAYVARRSGSPVFYCLHYCQYRHCGEAIGVVPKVGRNQTWEDVCMNVPLTAKCCRYCATSSKERTQYEDPAMFNHARETEQILPGREPWNPFNPDQEVEILPGFYNLPQPGQNVNITALYWGNYNWTQEGKAEPEPVPDRTKIERLEENVDPWNTIVEFGPKDTTDQERSARYMSHVTQPPPLNETLNERDRIAVLVQDCTVPERLELVRTPNGAKPCQNFSTHLEGLKKVKYLLLHTSETEQVMVSSCSARVSTIPSGCGMHSHQWTFHTYVEVMTSVPISIPDCETIWRTQRFVTPFGKVHSVLTGRENTIYSKVVGDVKASGSTGTCTGGTVTMPDGTVLNKAIVSQHINLKLHSLKGTADKDGNLFINGKGKLPCPATQGYCHTEEGAHFWTPPSHQPRCNLYKTREPIEGIETIDQEGQTVFTSRDTMIRLVLGRPFTDPACLGGRAVATNYHRLMVTKDFDNPRFQRTLPAEEASLFAYSNNKDDFLYHDFRREMTQRHADTLYEECMREVRNGRIDIASLAAEQGTSIDGHTTSLGNGWFATSAGDGHYRFKCKLRKAYARKTDRCYSSLPVELTPEDEAEYRQVLQIPDDIALELFMQPRSHQLVNRGIEIPCVPDMSPAYLGMYGQWILNQPRMNVPIKTPRELSKELIREDGATVYQEEAGKAGEDTGIFGLAMIQIIEAHIQRGRAVLDAATTWGREVYDKAWASGSHQGGIYTAKQFPMMGLEALPNFSTASWLINMLIKWGDFCAGAYGVYLILLFLYWMGGICCRTIRVPFHPEAGPWTRFFLAIFPNARHAMQRWMPRFRDTPAPRRRRGSNRQRGTRLELFRAPSPRWEGERPPAYSSLAEERATSSSSPSPPPPTTKPPSAPMTPMSPRPNRTVSFPPNQSLLQGGTKHKRTDSWAPALQGQELPEGATMQQSQEAVVTPIQHQNEGQGLYMSPSNRPLSLRVLQEELQDVHVEVCTRMGQQCSPGATDRDMELLTEITKLRSQLLNLAALPNQHVDIADLLRKVRSIRNTCIYNGRLFHEECLQREREQQMTDTDTENPDESTAMIRPSAGANLISFGGARPKQTTPNNSIYEGAE